jgi:hypothetical protein
MPNVAFFSFKEEDRGIVLTIKGRAVNPHYNSINFRVKDLLKRWQTENASVIKQAITKSIIGTSRTIVFVGENTWKSYWVPHEVQMTLERGKPVYAIRLKGVQGKIPSCLSQNGITVHPWSEANLQALATM